MRINGPYHVNVTSSQIVQANLKGAYILSRDGEKSHYIGRADDCLKTRIPRSAEERGCDYFWFSTANSRTEAFELECYFFHNYSHPLNADHPDHPDGLDMTCPCCGA